MKQSYRKPKEGDRCHSELCKDMIRGEYNNTSNKEDKTFIMKHGAHVAINMHVFCLYSILFFKTDCFRFLSINWLLGCWVVSC